MGSWPARMVTRCEICGQGPSRWHADRENPDHHNHHCWSLDGGSRHPFLSDASCTYAVIGATYAIIKHKPQHG